MSTMPFDDRLGKILDGVSEYIESAPAEDILEDVRLEGLDPAQSADEVRNTLRRALVLHGKAKLAEATRDYDEHAQVESQTVYQLPRSPADRRHLLQSAMALGGLTLQNREFSELTDEDVLVQLRSLAELGHLDDLDGPDGDE